MRTPLSTVRGLGSAKDGTHHFWVQRVTALGLIPLSVWFSASMISLTGADLAGLTAFLKAPVPLVMMLLFIGVGFHHLRLGLQVVIEDYVKDEGLRLATLLANTFACTVIGLAALAAVLKISFGA